LLGRYGPAGGAVRSLIGYDWRFSFGPLPTGKLPVELLLAASEILLRHVGLARRR
jgi:hypothetical protein